MIRFIVSYDYESTYEIEGACYRVRLGASRLITRPGVFEREVLPFVGTVRHDEYSGYFTLPTPAIVTKLAEMVGVPLVGACWEDDRFENVVYSGDVAETVERGDTMFCKPYLTACDILFCQSRQESSR